MNKKISIFFILTVVVAFALFYTTGRGEKKTTMPESAPQPVAAAPVSKVSTMDSPEGSKTLTVDDGSIYVSAKDESEKQLLYKKTIAQDENLEIPFNTWDPANTYFFLKDTTPESIEYLVFKSSGEKFTPDLPFLSVGEIFQSKVQGYVIEDITGWAAPDLLLVNAKQSSGDAKVSFWFEVPSRSFIQLSTYFK
jgi:hypothetical protein